uniref:V-type proton ATPase subunit H n=2 Tax=Ananas comosus TaxID=4615 RepID=A0A6V7NTG8_ANACO|nr:unnamed protein product [Ananas comosus var. bracteatus]
MGPVDVLLQSGDRRSICTGGYFDPTSVQWCTLGDGFLPLDCRLIADGWLLIISALIATARVHFTYTSGLIPAGGCSFPEKWSYIRPDSKCFDLFMDCAELTTEQVLKRDIPWEIYMSSKLISGTGLQLLRRYDKRTESQKASLLDDDGPAYVRLFVSILRDISKEEAVEYVLALIDQMLTANPKRARLFHDKSLLGDDIYEPFLS